MHSVVILEYTNWVCYSRAYELSVLFQSKIECIILDYGKMGMHSVVILENKN